MASRKTLLDDDGLLKHAVPAKLRGEFTASLLDRREQGPPAP